MRSRDSETPVSPVFDRVDWAAAGVATLIALTIYFATLAPNVTLEQSGALVVAGQYCGVGRMPGYPLWHMLAKLFITVFGFVRYRGCPNPAWATNFMSAFFGALSCGLVALLVAPLARTLSRREEAKEKAFAVAIAAGVIFAIGQAMWSQSVITETHTLTLFLVLLFLVAALVWLKAPGRASAIGMAATFGLGLAQSQMVVFLFPALVLALLLVRKRLCLEFCIASTLLWVAPAIIFFSRFSNPWSLIALAACGLLVMLLAMLLSSDRLTLLGMMLVIALGIAFYAYLPIASEGNPPMQFGYPRTWEGFMHTVMRGQYERISPTPVFSMQCLQQLGWYAHLLIQQYIFPLGLVALLPLTRILRFRGPYRKWCAVCGVVFLMFSVVLVIGASPKGDIQDSLIQSVKFIPSFALWAILVGLGLMMILDWLDAMVAGE
jgi:hypothetical protein